MATTLTDDAPLTYVSFPIDKARTRITADGDVEIYGKATDGIVDSDDQIVDPVWAAKAVKDWLVTGGNVRVQHQAMRDPAGKGLEVTHDEMGGQWVKALIVEPVAKNLVLKGVLRSYSIGIMHPIIVPDQLARNGRIIGGEMGELSLVDRPANKNCRFELVKRAKDGGTQWVGKMFGTPVPSPADVAKMLNARNGTALKRDFDPNVGGGVDRDKLSDADFAGPDRSFPIVTPQDVADIGPNLGHTKHDPEQVKRNAIRIARRKGPQFEAKIPDSWKKGSMADDTTTKGEGTPCSLCKGKGKIRKGKMTCPDCHGSGNMPTDTADKSVADGFVLKAGNACAHCDEFNEADNATCSKCGAKMAAGDDDDVLDKALFADMIVPFLAKGDDDDDSRDNDDDGDDSMDVDDDDNDDSDDSDDDDSDDDDSDDDDDDDDDDKHSDKSVTEPDVAKGKMNCPNCSGFMKAKQKFCPNCGKKAIAGVGKTARTEPTPGDGVTGMHTDPVPAHREPDGQYIEAFEADAKLPTDPDAEYKTAMHHQTIGVPRDMAVLHDLLCPVYHPAVTEKSYPGLSLLDVLDVDDWQMKAVEAAASAPLDEAQMATKRWQEASTLAQADAETITEIRHHAFKAFQDANIGPGTFPTPTTITPGQFKRPYITGGHARPSFQQAGPNTASVPTGQISAAQFDRDYISGGHAAESPANKAEDQGGVSAPEVTGKPQRMFYSNAQKDNAVQAMQQMHDHISRLFPDICGMGSETAAPKTDTAPAVGKAAKKQKSEKVGKTAAVTEAPGDLAEQMDMLTKAFTPDALKAAFASATAELTNQLAEANTRMKRQDKEIKRLNKAVGDLASMPDPRTAPFRGLAQPGALKSYGAQAASPSPAEIAARTQLSLMAELENDFRTSHDPSAREAAWNQLCKMRGITN
jgi:hypothetical protein